MNTRLFFLVIGEITGLRDRQLSVILEGNNGELLAVKLLGDNKYLVTIYKEAEEYGFVITAYLTKRINSLNKRKEVWSRSP